MPMPPGGIVTIQESARLLNMKRHQVRDYIQHALDDHPYIKQRVLSIRRSLESVM